MGVFENERAVIKEVAELVDEGVFVTLNNGGATLAELWEHFDA